MSRHTFSKRTAWDLSAVPQPAVSRQAGGELLDLTVSNPTLCGFEYDAEAILGPLADREAMSRALVYDPDPRGMLAAREAVMRYYADHGAAVEPDALVLTTSTSEAYTFIFRLLCDAGDEVLVPRPSYPLFDFLAELDDVRLKTYPLFYDFGWWIDFAELERSITPRTRAILVVHPNNPTGHWTHEAERQRLETLCERHGLALIVDEVFLDYPLTESAAASFATGTHPALTFVLSGLSKIAALPQMKLAWLAAFGPAAACREALARLEVIADTFLSMNAPAQLALPAWLSGRHALQRQIAARTRSNLEALQASGMEVLQVDAGWSALVRFRGIAAEAAAADAMRERHGIVVHPGSFYGIADRRIVVVSLLTECETMRRAVGLAAPLETSD